MIVEFSTLLGLGFTAIVVIAIFKGARVVPQRNAYVVERLGKYSRTLDAGFHVLIPFLDSVVARHSLKEQAIDVPSQHVHHARQHRHRDRRRAVPAGAGSGQGDLRHRQLLLRGLPARADHHALGDRQAGAGQAASRSATASTPHIVDAVDKACEPWGVKVMRYEISNINPPQTIRDALEKQMRAERERRALMADVGGRPRGQASMRRGPQAGGDRKSEAIKIRQINEAEGKAREIELLAEAHGQGIRPQSPRRSAAPGGSPRSTCSVAEQYLTEFGKLAKPTTP
jgi:regulator of protease activity HflC (stomatin/prohibitin superfamily)